MLSILLLFTFKHAFGTSIHKIAHTLMYRKFSGIIRCRLFAVLGFVIFPARLLFIDEACFCEIQLCAFTSNNAMGDDNSYAVIANISQT